MNTVVKEVTHFHAGKALDSTDLRSNQFILTTKTTLT